MTTKNPLVVLLFKISNVIFTETLGKRFTVKTCHNIVTVNPLTHNDFDALTIKSQLSQKGLMTRILTTVHNTGLTDNIHEYVLLNKNPTSQDGDGGTVI